MNIQLITIKLEGVTTVKSKINTIIAIYEMIGGIAGLYIIIMNGIVLKSVKYQLIALIIPFFILALNILSLIGGFLLWRGKEKGMTISIIIQIFQIPYILTANCVYAVVSGIQVIVGIGISSNIFKIILHAYWIPYFEIYFKNVVKYNVIAVNIIPIIIILHVLRSKKIAKNNQLEDKVTNVTVDILNSEGE